MKICKRILLIAIFIHLNISFTMAQQQIAGVYYRSTGNPEGGNTFFIYDDHRFVVGFFGGVITGTWKITNNEINFKPNVSDHHFYVYGRHNKTLQDSTRIYFQSFSERPTYVGFGKKETAKLLLKAVFNPNPNCVKYPSVAKFKELPNQIIFTDRPGSNYEGFNEEGEKRNVYTYENAEKYNDFIAYYVKDDSDKRPFSATLKDGKIFFDERKGLEKRPLPTEGEDFEFLQQILNTPRTTDTVFYNPFYKKSAEKVNDKNNWKFDEGKNAFVNLFNYTEGEENRPDEQDAYNNMNIIYQFNLLKLGDKKVVPFTIDPKPLFIATCKD